MFFSHRLNWTFHTVTALALTATLAVPARALNIIVNFDAANSSSPSFDPDGSLVMSMMREAERRWQDIIEDSHTLTIDVIYANVATADAAVLTTSDGQRADTARVRFSDTRDWYFDPTPGNDNEFNLAQTLYRDGDPTDFNTIGDGQPLLEVGYRGSDNSTAPGVSDGFDALSTAMHEIGHLVGITNDLIFARAEYADGDYDLPTTMTGGVAMGAKTNAANEPFHLLAVGPLMSGTGAQKGERRLPSATDVLAAAAASGWTQIDLTRQDFLAGSSFNSPTGWVGGQVPGAADEATVRNGGTANLSDNAFVKSLVIAEDSGVGTQANRLTVSQGTYVGSDSTLVVGGFTGTGTPTFTSQTLTVSDKGTVSMFGTDALIDVNQMLVGEDPLSSNANLEGAGTVEVSGSFVNNGLISGGFVLGGGTLTIRATGANTLDLDGEFSRGKIQAVLGDLTIDGPLTDGLSNQATIGKGRTMTFVQPWEQFGTLKMFGELNANGGPAILAGAVATLGGSIIADGPNNRIEALSKFIAGANVSIPDADDQLTIGTSTNWTLMEAGSFTGNGTLNLVGNTFVQPGATVNINVDKLNWDGVGLTETRLVSGSTLNINVSSITDGHNGPLRVYDSNLSLVTDSGKWELDGVMEINVPSLDTATVSGSTLHVRQNGEVRFNGISEVTAPLLVDGKLQFAGGRHHVDSITASAAATVDFDSGRLIAKTIQVEPTTGFNFDAGQLTFDTFDTSSDGTPGTLANTGGSLLPGDPLGIATVDGDYSQMDGGELVIELGGTQRGNEYDVLNVLGDITLAGADLVVSLINGFVPAVGDTFDILDFSSLGGSFSNIDLPAGFDWNTSQLLSDGILSLDSALGPDYDADGDVDGADFLAWQRGDGSASGLATWEASYGTLAIVRTASTAVPEPTTMLLAGVGIVSIVLRLRRTK